MTQVAQTHAAASSEYFPRIPNRAAPRYRDECHRTIGVTLSDFLSVHQRHLEKVLAEYVGYFNRWRPHRANGQRAPCAPAISVCRSKGGKIIAKSVLGGLHHMYQQAT
jgi:transposase InsO family protein